MEKDFAPDNLDVQAFARSAGQIGGDDALARYKRLAEDLTGSPEDRTVRWSAAGELRTLGGSPSTWMHLSGDTLLPMTCQRCLTPVDVPVSFETDFRFVADEATAEAEDDEAEEDLLVISRELHLRELIEDELLLAMPPVPLHEVCPITLPTVAEDPDFAAAEEEREHPFSILAGLTKGKLG